MRNIENEMRAAMAARKNWSKDNTEVTVTNGELSVLLHGNYIFRIVDGVAWFTLAGWDTATTRSRLRALGVGLESKSGARYYNGVKLDTRAWYNV